MNILFPQIPFPAVTINNDLMLQQEFKYGMITWAFYTPRIKTVEKLYPDQKYVEDFMGNLRFFLEFLSKDCCAMTSMS
jgi:hypothetical protein